MVQVEAGVFCGDYGVLEVGRDLAEGHEVKLGMIRLAVDPGLKAALDVDGCCGWVDEAEGDQGERGKEPEGGDRDAEPAEAGPEEVCAPGGLCDGMGWCAHFKASLAEWCG